MFGEMLTITSATDEWCDVIFKNITCPDIYGDVTLKTILNLLISPRLSEGESFQCKNEPVDEGSENTLFVYKDPSLRADSETPPKGFRYLKDLSLFLSQYEPVKVFINEEKRSAYVTAMRMTMPVVHIFSGLIPRILPWFFKESPLTADERTLVTSLTKKDSREFLSLVNKYMEKYDIRSLKIEKYLKDIEKAVIKTEIKKIEDNIRNTQCVMKDLLTRYKSEVNRLEDFNLRMDGYMHRLSKPTDNKLMNYFQANKTLDLLTANGMSFEFIVDTYLDNFDCQKYRTVSNNLNSSMYTRGSDPFFKDGAKRKVLFDDIFSAMPRLKIRTCSYFEINLSGYSEIYSGYDYPCSYKDHIPNPHIHHNGCLGSNGTCIGEALRDGDTIMAIESCVAAAKNVNIMESASFGPFCDDIFGRYVNAKCIKLPDGSFCTPEEAYAWIIENPREE